ncbi:MAG: hypothetical protein NWF01_10105 [Candidatus Bathyarchaeota archaeon]|nr:hypothetical protein [Candidatus Bathyarchaeota archaeon]
MRKTVMLLAAAALIIVMVIATVFIVDSMSLQEKQPFYVGVTYCGDSADEAKQLIDKVKGYTNLFVVQSGPLQHYITELEATCDYAVDAGLNIIVYFGSDPYPYLRDNIVDFIAAAPARWGDQFLGVYYGDEPGGKMLDLDQITLYTASNEKQEANIKIVKGEHGYIAVNNQETDSPENRFLYNSTSIRFFADGQISIQKNYQNNDQKNLDQKFEITTYFPNGTIAYRRISAGDADTFFGPYSYQPDGTVQDEKGTAVTGQGDISQFEPYQQVLDSNPLQTTSKLADAFAKSLQISIDAVKNQSCTFFTSDYGLYWWDYQGGYDVVFGELGWNHTTAQDIALVRGAANLQNKDWGTIITWKYTHSPYLADGQEVFEQMRMSYECGAKYLVIFNYAENMTGPCGTLQDEHFEALERFWNDVVQNPWVNPGSVQADAVLVLPEDFGWGMRRPDDSIWGLWPANSTSTQIWTQLQNMLQQYGTKLDIIYNDPQYPVTGKYAQVYYWNQ